MYADLSGLVNKIMIPTENRVSAKKTTDYKAKFNKPNDVAKKIKIGFVCRKTGIDN